MSTVAARRRHPLALAVLLTLALMVIGLVYSAASSMTEAEAASASPVAATQIEEGRQLFLEGCSSCHGLNAQGGTDNAQGITGPTLVGVGAAAVDFQVGTGRMPLSYPQAQAPQGEVQYTQDEIDAMAAYVASLGPGPSVPSEEDLDLSDADVARGGDLWRGNCAQCHNSSGAGGALTDGKYAPNLNDATPRQIWNAMTTGPQSMPVFADGTVTPEEKRDIISYIVADQEADAPGGFTLGQVGPVSEGLMIWVVGLGVLAAVAVWIGAKSS